MMNLIKNHITSADEPCKHARKSTAALKKKQRSALGAVVISASMLVTGCANYNRDHFTVGSVPDDYRTRHPIVVSEKETARDLIVPRNFRKLSQRDLDVIRDTGLHFKRSGARSMALMIPSGSPNAHAARKAASQAVDELLRTGLSANQISIHHYRAASHGDSATLRMVYNSFSAGVNSECGTWNEDITDTKENRNYYNFGCATQNNLAQMISNPADLLSPRGTSEIDSTKRTTAIEDWRTTNTSLPSSSE